MKYMKPRVVAIYDSFIERAYIKPLIKGWISQGNMKELNMYLDLQFQPFETCMVRI